MNILIMTLLDINDMSEHGIYTDLLREFIADGHHVCLVSPTERRYGMTEDAKLISKDGWTILKVRIGNVQKTNVIEKGISTLLIERQFTAAIDKYLSDVRFDALLYSTPPITFGKVIEHLRKRDGAKTYLLLKDIFPQNAIDLGMFRENGVISAFFRRKERRLYEISDHIGCMSQANVDYLLAHNSWLCSDRVEVCPNSIEPQDVSVSAEQREALRLKYGIPTNKKVFVYGGNLGKPQDIDFLVRCLETQRGREDAFFLIVGSGTEYPKLEQYVEAEQPAHVKLLQKLPRDEYDRMIASCDVGMIFLSDRFTIPNFPSRLLSYMQASLPVLAVTDTASDVGEVVTKGGFGWWCRSNDASGFARAVENICAADTKPMGLAAREYLEQHYTARECCDIITASLGIGEK
ncbi:MAG: glycosyltransferase family 4 protein [Clostridia bacterium]|nr:glycosyltransferase family 4 protein [Clostridia bacterium]